MRLPENSRSDKSGRLAFSSNEEKVGRGGCLELLRVQLDVAAAQIVLGVVVEAAGVRQRYAEVVRAVSRFAVISRSDGECVSRSAVDLSWPAEGPGVARPGVGSHITFHLHSRTVVEVGELTARSCAPWFEASNEAEVRV